MPIYMLESANDRYVSIRYMFGENKFRGAVFVHFSGRARLSDCNLARARFMTSERAMVRSRQVSARVSAGTGSPPFRKLDLFIYVCIVMLRKMVSVTRNRDNKILFFSARVLVFPSRACTTPRTSATNEVQARVTCSH